MGGMVCFCCLLSFPCVASHKAIFGDIQRNRICSNNSSYMAIYTLELFSPKVFYLHFILLRFSAHSASKQQRSTHTWSAIISVTQTQVSINKVSIVVQIHVYVYTFIDIILWTLILILISYTFFPARSVSFFCVHKENIINYIINLWWHSLGVIEIGSPKTIDRLH